MLIPNPFLPLHLMYCALSPSLPFSLSLPLSLPPSLSPSLSLSLTLPSLPQDSLLIKTVTRCGHVKRGRKTKVPTHPLVVSPVARGDNTGTRRVPPNQSHTHPSPRNPPLPREKGHTHLLLVHREDTHLNLNHNPVYAHSTKTGLSPNCLSRYPLPPSLWLYWNH